MLCGTALGTSRSASPRLVPRELKLVVLAGAARDEAKDAGREGLCRRRVLLSLNEPLRPAVFCSLGTRAGSLRLSFGSGPVADGTDCDTPHQIPFPSPRLPCPDMSMVRPTRQGGPSESCCTHPLHASARTPVLDQGPRGVLVAFQDSAYCRVGGLCREVRVQLAGAFRVAEVVRAVFVVVQSVND